MAPKMPVSDLSRAIAHEQEQEWPDSIAIVATWKDGDKTTTVTREIPADQFFGNGAFGAPISGQWFIATIDRMRKMVP